MDLVSSVLSIQVLGRSPIADAVGTREDLGMDDHVADEGNGVADTSEHDRSVRIESFAGASTLARPAATGPSDATRPRLARARDHALVGGVAAGIADYFGIPPLVVRLCFVGLAAASGIGLVVYPLAWALMPAGESVFGGGRRDGRVWLSRWPEAAGIIVLGLVGLLGLRTLGVWFGDVVVWPLVLASAGVALIIRQGSVSGWVPADALRRGGAVGDRSRWRDWPAAVLGVALIACAAVLFSRNAGFLIESRQALGGIVVILVAIGLVVGPWLVRLVQSLGSERSQRIRSEERAEMAAHLHDSVLQTLALIQRRADDPRAVTGLARRQERELRQWLFDRDVRRSPDSVVVALERAGADVEAVHGVRVEAVTVGDCGLDERLGAVVAAAREALTNAAKFSGEQRIDVYAEVCAERVEVFVRDRGVGFDPTVVADDRQGVRYSIMQRMARHGGQAQVRSRPGQGTEVELVMQRRRS